MENYKRETQLIENVKRLVYCRKTIYRDAPDPDTGKIPLSGSIQYPVKFYQIFTGYFGF